MKTAGAAALESHIRPLQRVWLYVVGALVLAFLLIPCVLIVPVSLSGSQFLEFPPRHWSTRWYDSFFASPEWLTATRLSLELALSTTLIATPLGTAAAYAVAGLRARAAQSGLRLLFLAPMMIPSILVAVALFLTYADIGLNNSFAGLLLADVTLAMPLVVIAVTTGLDGYDISQEAAARGLGATRLRAFITVTLPQIWQAIGTAAVFAFITSFDEAVIAIFVSGGDNETLTKRMFEGIRDQIDPTVAAVSSMLMLLSILVLAVTQIFQKAK